jgi:hypothetical protein
MSGGPTRLDQPPGHQAALPEAAGLTLADLPVRPGLGRAAPAGRPPEGVADRVRLLRQVEGSLLLGVHLPHRPVDYRPVRLAGFALVPVVKPLLKLPQSSQLPPELRWRTRPRDRSIRKTRSVAAWVNSSSNPIPIVLNRQVHGTEQPA